MNARIRELAEQAEDWADKQNFYESDYRDYFNEKFAELVIRKCAKVADLAEEHKCEWIGGNILTHFGVRE